MNKYLMPAALSAALMAPLAAHAVTTTITADGVFSSTGLLLPDGSVELEFVADGALDIDEFTLSGLGAAVDVEDISFSVTANDGSVVASGGFDIVPLGEVGGTILGLGTSSLPSLRLFDGYTVTVLFLDGITSSVSVSASLATSEVPLPAAGGMLLTGLAAAGFVARRKKKTAA